MAKTLLQKQLQSLTGTNVERPSWKTVDQVSPAGIVILKDGTTAKTLSPVTLKEGDQVLVAKDPVSKSQYILKFKWADAMRVPISSAVTVPDIIIVHVGLRTNDFSRLFLDLSGAAITVPTGFNLTGDGKYLTIEATPPAPQDDPDFYDYVFLDNGTDLLMFDDTDAYRELETQRFASVSSGRDIKSRQGNTVRFVLNEQKEREMFVYYDYFSGETPVRYLQLFPSLCYQHFAIQSGNDEGNRYTSDGIISASCRVKQDVNNVAVEDGVFTVNFGDTFSYIPRLIKKYFDLGKHKKYIEIPVDDYGPGVLASSRTGAEIRSDLENLQSIIRPKLTNLFDSVVAEPFIQETFDIEKGTIEEGAQYVRGASRLDVVSIGEATAAAYFGGAAAVSLSEDDGITVFVTFDFSAFNAYDENTGELVMTEWFERRYRLVVNGYPLTILPVTSGFTSESPENRQAFVQWFADSINASGRATASVVTVGDNLFLQIVPVPGNVSWANTNGSEPVICTADTIRSIEDVTEGKLTEVRLVKNADFTQYKVGIFCQGNLIEGTSDKTEPFDYRALEDMILRYSDTQISSDGNWLENEWGMSFWDGYLRPALYVLPTNYRILHSHFEGNFSLVVYSKTEIMRDPNYNTPLISDELLPYRYKRYLPYVGLVPNSSYYKRNQRVGQGYGAVRRTRIESSTSYHVFVNGKIFDLKLPGDPGADPIPITCHNNEFYLSGHPDEVINENPVLYASNPAFLSNPFPLNYLNVGFDGEGVRLKDAKNNDEKNFHVTRVFSSVSDDSLLVNIDVYKVLFWHFLQYGDQEDLLPMYFDTDFPPLTDSKDSVGQDRLAQRQWLLFDTGGNMVNSIQPPKNQGLDWPRVNGLSLIKSE